MQGFDLTKLLPLYLDETDDLVGALNDALLLLEQTPDDAKALQEAFRHVHTIKGSSTLMGFDQVKDLTHQLETIFDQLRSKKRRLDSQVLELFFRCLDGLRDFHLGIRRSGSSDVDLSHLTAGVVAHLAGEAAAPIAIAAPPTAQTQVAAAPALTAEPGRIGLRVTFEPGLRLADMKAKLILERLGSMARILSTDPALELIEESETLPGFDVWLASEATLEALVSTANVDGVTEILPLQGDFSPPSPPASAVASAGSVTRDEPPVARAAPVDDQARPAEPDSTAADAQESRKTKVAETVRVDIDRLDSLMNLAGELVINKAHFLQISAGLEELYRRSNAHQLASETEDRLESLGRGLEGLAASASGGDGAAERWVSQVRGIRENFRDIREEFALLSRGRERVKALTEAIDQLARVSSGIQKGVLNTRMVPIGPLFGRFRRVVRDLCVSSGKDVALRISGEKTELDKRMIDELGDPLIHMVRNSVDHGLETPDERRAAGKPGTGTVTLAAAHRGNSVVISVSDDGRGIDCERIRAKIVANGLASEEQARQFSERELTAFIWHPGLSTAERITDISGRGVGMDIVKSRIESLNGAVDVRSVLGQGATFTVRLPLTLAIMTSLLARIYDEFYAIPLDHVDEIVETRPGQVHKIQGRRALELRGKIIPLVSLNDVFRWAGSDHPSFARANPGDDVSDKATVVIAQNGETTIGLVVDELIGIQEVVLKSLEKNFQPVPGLSGASIMGDGRVSLILDIDAAIGMVARDARRAPLGVGT
jgi:two-component system, chemotaxis family, sensor kinase CheA